MNIQLRFLPFVALALLFALWAGLVRMGWQLPTSPDFLQRTGR